MLVNRVCKIYSGHSFLGLNAKNSKLSFKDTTDSVYCCDFVNRILYLVCSAGVLLNSQFVVN